MRVITHSDKTQIKELGDLILEADSAIDSLNDKARYSRRMEEERK